MSNPTTEYPADRLGNTNPLASAVKEVVGAHDDASGGPPAVAADRASGAHAHGDVGTHRNEGGSAVVDRSGASKASPDAASGGENTSTRSQDPSSQRRGQGGDRSSNAGAKVDAMRAKAADLTDQVVAYTREEPLKALLFAAAVGAVLVTVLGSAVRSRD